MVYNYINTNSAHMINASAYSMGSISNEKSLENEGEADIASVAD